MNALRLLFEAAADRVFVWALYYDVRPRMPWRTRVAIVAGVVTFALFLTVVACTLAGAP